MGLKVLKGTGARRRPFPPPAVLRVGSANGASLVEVVIVLGLITSVLGAGVPTLIQSADARRTRDAASFLAGQFRLARQRAVLTGRHVAIVFDDVGDEVGWRVCEDHDRDGLSREDIASGSDRCEGVVQPLSFRFAEVRIGYQPGVPSPDDEAEPSPLRFGITRMAVFTPVGTASAGTVAVRGPGGNQSAVRVSGVTGRTRTLRFEPGRGVWVE